MNNDVYDLIIELCNKHIEKVRNEYNIDQLKINIICDLMTIEGICAGAKLTRKGVCNDKET